MVRMAEYGKIYRACLKGISLLVISFITLIVAGCGNKNDEKLFNSFLTEELPQLAVGDSLQGVAAPFAGMDGEWLIVAGGCNFPDTSAASGGEKRFYADVFVLSTANPHGWVSVGQLPRPLAYGASVVTPDGIVCMGGTSDGKISLRDVFLLKDGGSRCEPLPSLPKGLD